MEADLINIFQSFAFPVALDVVLIFVIRYIAKCFLEESRKREDEAAKTLGQFIAYLQQNHIDLTAALMENATAMKENAQALNKFSMVLENMENKLNNIKN